MSLSAPHTIIVVAGPTAVGKTSLAIALAQYYGTEILSADSRQCYTEMNIGVARPSVEELAAVPHHFIASHSIHEAVDAAVYEAYALQHLEDIFRKSTVAIVVGGTGLYIKALCEGVDEMPAIPEAIREKIRHAYAEHGIGWLQNELHKKDPLFTATGEMQNPHRMLRALEFVESTGQSIKNFHSGTKKHRPFNIIKIGLELPKAVLHDRIHQRVDIMIQEGQEAEARALLPWQHLKALQTVGYRELFDHFNGLCDLPKAIELIKISTRQYAKRQMTWFKKDTEFQWFSPFDKEAIIAYNNKQLLGEGEK